MKVIKRDGRVIDFDKSKIINAISKAMSETINGIDMELCKTIADEIFKEVKTDLTVDNISDLVENKLMDSNRKDVAKTYILYRNQRDKNRKTSDDTRLLTDEFISKYKHMQSPMNQLASFVYYRTYSRFLHDEHRREYWWETVRRSVEYNCSLAPTTREEAEALFDNIINLKQFLSGRTFWIGGTEVSKNYPMGNFNCAGIVIDKFEKYKDLFYALMVGTGIGFRILKEDIDKLPSVRTDIELTHKEYESIPKGMREESTTLEFIGDIAKIVVADSKEGWCQSIEHYFKLLYSKEYRKIKTIIIDYDNVRPKGEKLITFGGTASGHESIKTMFTKIHKLIKNKDKLGTRVKLRPIDCMDIANIIGENVVVGGVRRTAEITLFDSDDEEVIKAKSNLFTQINGKWVENEEISHRKMSNNSIMYYNKPTREKLHWHVEQMRYSGEPAFFVAQNALKRRIDFKIPNPCGRFCLK